MRKTTKILFTGLSPFPLWMKPSQRGTEKEIGTAQDTNNQTVINWHRVGNQYRNTETSKQHQQTDKHEL
jgi:hypothetical protein